MLTIQESDYWVGDVIEIQGSLDQFLVENFFTKNGFTYANAYQIYGGYGPVLNHPDDINFFLGSDISVSSCSTEIVNRVLVGAQLRLWTNATIVKRFKRRLSGSGLMKVIICLIKIYSDDTSRNDSKQYNVYNSFLMYFAVMTLEKQNKQENTLFVCICNHVLNVVNMLGPLVNDLVTLEKDIQIYSQDLGKHVLVVTSLLLFMSDNSHQSQLAMHKGTASKRF
ncbi:hypothetical protein F4703DRAFT_1934017 [Phycomyces blakesleeanus]